MKQSKQRGPTRGQLMARVERLEAELRRFRAGDTVRSVGEHWYELLEYFDASQIQRIPSPWDEPTFLMGMLSDTFVVEVPQSAPPDEVAPFLDLLKRNGIAPALAIRKGVRFLRLAAVDEEQEARLDAAKQKVLQEEAGHGEEEDPGILPTLRPAEGLEEDLEVPPVPGAADFSAEDGPLDPLPDPARE